MPLDLDALAADHAVALVAELRDFCPDAPREVCVLRAYGVARKVERRLMARFAELWWERLAEGARLRAGMGGIEGKGG